MAAVSISASVVVAGASPAAGGQPTLDVVPTTEISQIGSVEITVTGAPDGTALHQCALPVGAGLEGSRCDRGFTLPLDDQGGYVTSLGVNPVVYTPELEPIDCRVEDCAFVLFDASGARLVEPVPITFAPPPTLTAEPSEGLLDGQDMAVVAEHLPPGQDFFLSPCLDFYTCESPTTVVPRPDGRIETTVVARQRFTAELEIPVYCRANCRLRLWSPLGGILWADYAMAEGELAVTPAAGLRDGQRVRVTGRELMPTYAGVPVGPFPTGGWALTQCDRAVLDQPSLFGVFAHCSIAPPTRGVTVEGSTLDAAFEVEATVTKMLGGRTDCAAGPGACVVGLVRFEEDNSLSTHLVPITFG